MAKIKMDKIRAATDKTRVMLSLSGLVVERSQRAHGVQALLTGANGLSAVCLLGYSFYHFRHNLEKLSGVCYHFMLCLVIAITPCVTWNWRSDFNRTLNGTYWSYDYRSDLMTKRQNEIQEERAKRIKTMYTCAASSTAFMMVDIVLLSVVKRCLNIDDVFLLFPCWFPFDLTALPVHVLVVVWEQFLLFCTALMIHGGTCFKHLIFCYVKAEVRLLNFAMTHLRERALELAGNVEGNVSKKSGTSPQVPEWCYVVCTKMCAQHHSDIISYFEGAATITQAIYMLIFFIGVLLCTFSGFLIISDNTALKIQFTVISIIQFIFLFIVCWVGEKVSSESLSVRDTIYGIDWSTLPKESKSIMKIMMVRACYPLQMKVLRGQKVNLELYMTAVKASYSYINMMLAMTE